MTGETIPHEGQRPEIPVVDIRSLTQPFVPDLERALIFLHACEQTRPRFDSEWAALPLPMRSRGIQMRLRGSRKVRDSEKVRFVLDLFFSRSLGWMRKPGVILRLSGRV